LTEKINKILQDLVGLPLTRTTRAANMECLKFGTLHLIDTHGETWNYGVFGLHLQCPWRLTNDNEIIVGSNDLYEQADETADWDENFNWEELNANLRDVKLDKFITERKHIVKSVIADNYGGLQICFDSKVILTVFPVIASKADNEFWRLLDNTNETKNHYVSNSTGYDLGRQQHD
jgi:hypothetical protein